MRKGKRLQMVMFTWLRWWSCQYMQNPLKTCLLQNQKAHDLGTWYVVLGMGSLHVISNADPRLTLTYLASRLNVLPYVF